MRMKKSVHGVKLRGLRDRRLVVSSPLSIEPMAVSIPVREIRQVAVLAAEPSEERRFVVAAQVSLDKWVRLAVLERASDAQALIEECALAMSCSRAPVIWASMGMGVVWGAVYFGVVMGMLEFAQRTGEVPTEAVAMPSAAAPAAELAPAPVAPALPAEAAPAAAQQPSAGLTLPADQEGKVKDFFKSSN